MSCTRPRAGLEPSTRPQHIVGTYRFTKRYLSNTCGTDRELVDQRAVVAMIGESSRFTFDDGVVTFRGHLLPDGGFRMDTVMGQDAQRNTLTVVLEGTFRREGFDATLRVAQQRPPDSPLPPTCAYTIVWTGTREPEERAP